MMAKKRIPSVQIPSARSEDQPASRKMLALVRDELKSDIRALEQRMEGGFSDLQSANSRMQLLLEEQNANNRVVLEGLQALWQRQDRIEQQSR